MFHCVKSVAVMDDYKLKVTFNSCESKVYDVKSLFDKSPVFEALKNNSELFSKVKIDVGGYGVVWNDEIDISCEELWKNGRTDVSEVDSSLETVRRKEHKSSSFYEFLEEMKQNPEFKKEYDALREEFEEVQKKIDAEKNGQF